MARRQIGRALPPTPRRVIYLIGVVLVGVGLTMLPSAAAAAFYAEWGPMRDLLVSTAITVGIGAAASAWAGRPDSLSPKEAFAAVALAWASVVWFGALPLILSGTIPGLTDAVFEATAGLTTTGATVITDLSAVPNGILLWRATMQWLGGMGIIVLSIAVLPLLGAGGVQLARAEAPGPEPDRLTPRFRGTAVRLWGLYVGFTVLAAVLLAFGDMTVFEAIAHALTNISSGGFSTTSESIGAFNAYTQWVVIAFMFIAGTSFALHYRALFRPMDYLANSEFRVYLGVIIASILLVLAGFSVDTVSQGHSVRDAIFTVLTLVTGTGYATVDFATWGAGLLILLVVLMFFGGMAGSTTGALKTYRVALLARLAVGDVRRLNRPAAITVTRFGGAVIDPLLLRNIASFFILYITLFVVGTLTLAFFEGLLGAGIDVVTATSAAASALGNVGPGLGEVGPASTYASIVTPGKWVLATMMLMGRLEIFPVLLLVTPAFWRR